MVLWFRGWQFREQCSFHCCRYGKQSSVNHFEGSNGPIWLDDVNCSGKEASFIQCSRRQWGRHDCSHREDVGLTCYPDSDGHRLSPGKDGMLLLKTQASSLLLQPLVWNANHFSSLTYCLEVCFPRKRQAFEFSAPITFLTLDLVFFFNHLKV